jgi:hypothetical protein
MYVGATMFFYTKPLCLFHRPQIFFTKVRLLFWPSNQTRANHLANVGSRVLTKPGFESALDEALLLGMYAIPLITMVLKRLSMLWFLFRGLVCHKE